MGCITIMYDNFITSFFFVKKSKENVSFFIPHQRINSKINNNLCLATIGTAEIKYTKTKCKQDENKI